MPCGNKCKTIDSIVEQKSFAFSIRIVKLYKFITEDKKEYVLSKQLLRSGTSIGANVAEGESAQSKADFYSKMSIALKEANETYYWLRLLNETDFINVRQFESLEKDIKELIALLTSICRSSQNQM